MKRIKYKINEIENDILMKAIHIPEGIGWKELKGDCVDFDLTQLEHKNISPQPHNRCRIFTSILGEKKDEVE